MVPGDWLALGAEYPRVAYSVECLVGASLHHFEIIDYAFHAGNSIFVVRIRVRPASIAIEARMRPPRISPPPIRV
jgi:hypothetical protein